MSSLLNLSEVKISGVRIECEEVSAVLKAHPVVADALVTASWSDSHDISWLSFSQLIHDLSQSQTVGMSMTEHDWGSFNWNPRW